MTNGKVRQLMVEKYHFGTATKTANIALTDELDAFARSDT